VHKKDLQFSRFIIYFARNKNFGFLFLFILIFYHMYKLEAKIRTDDARTTREAGRIPGVIYGKDVPSTKLSVGISEFVKIYREAGKSQLITVSLDGKKYNTLVQEAQRHPVRGNFLHLDFINVDMKSQVEVQIPIVLVGTSPAVVEGGQLHQTLQELTVKCLPGDIVESFELDISGLTMGHSLHVSDIKLDEKKFEVINHLEDPVVGAQELKKQEEEEVVVAADTAAGEAEAADTAAPEKAE